MTALRWCPPLIIALPAVATVVGMVVPRPRRSWQIGVAITGSVAALGVSLIHAALTADGKGGLISGIPLLPPIPTGGVLITPDVRTDPLAAVISVMVLSVACAVQVYSVGYQRSDQRYRSYAATVSLFTAAMLLVVHADDLLVMLIGWEVMGLCSYLLIGHDSQRRAARAAAVKAFLITRVADIGFVLGVVMLWSATGTADLSRVIASAPALPGARLTSALVLIMIGVLGKSAQFPLHTWLPDAMEGPTPVSALIHAATMVVAGAVVLARLLPLLVAVPAARLVLAVVTAVTMVGAAAVACVQDDLKRVLAWSTISQVGYVLAALAVVPAGWGPASSVMHLVSHAGFKALLFLAAGLLAFRCGSTALTNLAGAGRHSPMAAFALTAGLAALAGLPPLSGFWSKEVVISAAEHAAHDGSVAGWVVFVAAMIAAALTAGYVVRTWWLVVPQGASPATPGRGVAGPAMRWPVLLLLVPTVLGGGLLGLGGLGEVHVNAGTAMVTVVMVLIVLALVSMLARHGDPIRVLPGLVRHVLLAGFGVDASLRVLVTRPVCRVAGVVRAADRTVLDAVVRGVVWATRGAGITLRRSQTGAITGYLAWSFAGVLVAAILGMGWR
ncbi:MAG: NADH-quinone oxidoreductase subunit 5 family protein [Actinomycetota bacterium]